MNIICRPRQSGKTTDLIKACVKYGGYIVCHNRKECHRVATVAKDLGFNIPFPISYDEFLGGLYHLPGIKHLHIDNVDMLLQRMSKVPILTVTINKI